MSERAILIERLERRVADAEAGNAALRACVETIEAASAGLQRLIAQERSEAAPQEAAT